MSKRECKDGWIKTYIEYTKPQQSPTIFHTWTAISVIASALRRRCWLDRSFYLLYPNLYVIFVSESGVGMKSSSAKIGINLLAKALPHLTLMRGKLTTSYLVDWMLQAQAKNPDRLAEVTVFASEFRVFAKGTYADSTLIEDLTDLYDCDTFEYRTKNKGIYLIEKPCVNLLACSTPDWLTTGSAADFIGGGFSSRILPVTVITDEKLIANPKKMPLSDEMEKKLIADLQRIEQLKGPFSTTKEADDLFEEWYLKKDMFKNPDQRLKGYYSKKHTQVHKVAMVLSASVSDDMLITADHIESALSLLGKLETTMPYAYQGITWSERTKFRDKVWGKIMEGGMVFHSKLLETFHYCMTRDDLRHVMATLIDEEKVSFDRITTKGRPRIVYVTEWYIKDLCKKEGKEYVKSLFPNCFKTNPEWFGEKEDEKDA